MNFLMIIFFEDTSFWVYRKFFLQFFLLKIYSVENFCSTLKKKLTPNLTITGAFFSIQFNFLYSTINFISAPSVSIRSAIVLTTTSGTFGLSSFKVRYIFFLFLRGCCCYCCFYIILFYLLFFYSVYFF